MALSPELLALSDIPEEDEDFFNPEHGYFGYEKAENEYDVELIRENFGEEAYQMAEAAGAEIFYPDENNDSESKPYLIEYAGRVIELKVGNPGEVDKFFVLNFAMKAAYQEKDSYENHDFYYEKPDEYDENGREFVTFFRQFTRALDPAATLYISTEDPRLFDIYKKTFTDPETGELVREKLHVELQDSRGWEVDSLSTV